MMLFFQVTKIFSVFLVLTSVKCKENSAGKSSSQRVSCSTNDTVFGRQEDTSDRLRRLRLRMKASSYDAYIIPSADEHQSEYVSDYDRRRQFISGFTGSSGTAVVLSDRAALWTDSRYVLQAQRELDCNWLLMDRNGPHITEWIILNLQQKQHVGADSKLIPHDKWLYIQTELERAGLSFVEDTHNLIDDIWNIPQGRIPESLSRIFVHDIKYAGKSWEEKVLQVRNSLQVFNASGTIVSALDEIAWLMNLRGSDVPYNPVFKSYVYLTLNRTKFYIKSSKLTSEVKNHLCPTGNLSQCVEIGEYQNAFEDMKQMGQSEGRLWLPSSLSHAIINLFSENQKIVSGSPSIISILKVVKNPVEIEGLKNAALKDSVAFVDFMAMLEEQVGAGKHWDEMKAAEILAKYRREQELNQGDSFPTISAVGSNAAIVHYRPQLLTNRNINSKHIYLLDTGGQYLDGTTDITRTFHFGVPKASEVAAYTSVLVGAIDLMSSVFPNGTTGSELDIIARLPLYRLGLEYLHGTGHGIGHFLNVHEGPIRISSNKACKDSYPLHPGMFLSDEPGYYEENQFGIRLETMMVVVKAETPYHFNQKTYFAFEPVSFVPFEPKLIDWNILNSKQTEWLKAFNRRARETVGNELRRQGRERGLRWLLSKTLTETSSCCHSIFPSSLLMWAILLLLRSTSWCTYNFSGQFSGLVIFPPDMTK